MGKDDPNAIRVRQELILASALFNSRPPTDVIRASCARVLRAAMRAAGVWQPRFNDGFEDDKRFRVVRLWYSTLIELVRHEPVSERRLEGGGNLIDPAGAFFTACWLTPAGQAVAEHLIANHPEWKSALTEPQRGCRFD